MNHPDSLDQLAASLIAVNRYLRYTTFGLESRTITRVQWLLLRHLSNEANQTIGQLAVKLDVQQSTMSQMLDRLEKSGLVLRQISETDTRVKTVILTDAGYAVIQQTEQAWKEKLAEPFEQFSQAEKLMLVELLGRLVDKLPTREDNK
ncbi:MarR family transcriptional regulator [Paenibacillus sp. HWE-109]|uniref:MarR family winged helix-turn-helix transcriptional regulator n=1 Tax=Paenibacillus sp. HWE-109 TaxID=1306526 RepID=UPI001EE0387C|nr:MarR family transcriptional regulator [Paenibacillus sp. HWE-109]UKS29248.1 MarR family transcriptional regulator [Paenibacillus sp. HWE-109]